MQEPNSQSNMRRVSEGETFGYHIVAGKKGLKAETETGSDGASV